MANFKPKKPITGFGGNNYPDTLENFLKIRKAKKEKGNDIKR